MRSPRSLTTRTQFAAVFADGHRTRSDGVTVWALAQEKGDPQLGDPRLGLSVGTGAGPAVERNRMRRRLRALVRSTGLGAVDLVIRADREAMNLNYQELEGHLSSAISRATRGTP